ncbi:hypothetical protein ACFL1H_00260 [Nanoarchaeota archaeon]
MIELNNKGQVMLFVLVAVIIVVLGGFFLYINQTAISNVNGQPNQNIDVKLLTQNYVESCLKNSLEDGIELLSRQGGFIYEDQGGPYECCPVKYEISGSERVLKRVEYDGYNVTYSLYKPDVTAPTYPTGSFGKKRVPLIDQDVGTKYSLESQLNEYIKSQIDDCLNEIEDTIIKNITDEIIISDILNVDTDIFNKKVNSELTLPIKLTIGENIINLDKFNTEVKVKLGLMYKLLLNSDDDVVAVSLIEQMITNGTYYINSWKINNTEFGNITVYRQNFDYYSIIVIKDEDTIFKGDKLKLVTVVDNRLPVLNHFSYNVGTIGGFTFQVIVNEGNHFVIEPKASDPDNDEYHFYFENETDRVIADSIAVTEPFFKVGTNHIKIVVNDSVNAEDHEYIYVLINDNPEFIIQSSSTCICNCDELTCLAMGPTGCNLMGYNCDYNPYFTFSPQFQDTNPFGTIASYDWIEEGVSVSTNEEFEIDIRDYFPLLPTTCSPATYNSDLPVSYSIGLKVCDNLGACSAPIPYTFELGECVP